ncbi:MAG: NAD(P)H-dependent oxidoreductase [Chitinophagaceae bacterium]|nr:NAD(P)H-dependent oxidoreductase [Chitinophagaceae bacterium]
MNIIIVSGSIRENASTKKVALNLFNHFQRHHNVVTEVVDLKEYDYPIWKQVFDKEENPPAKCIHLHKKLKNSDAMVFITPEYNGGYSLALKNMIDYFGLKVFEKKTIGVTAVSTGGMGGIRAGLQLQQLILAIYAIPVPQMLLVPNIQQRFDNDGVLLDASFEKNVSTFTNEFIWLAEAVYEKHRAVGVSSE